MNEAPDTTEAVIEALAVAQRQFDSNARIPHWGRHLASAAVRAHCKALDDAGWTEAPKEVVGKGEMANSALELRREIGELMRIRDGLMRENHQIEAPKVKVTAEQIEEIAVVLNSERWDPVTAVEYLQSLGLPIELED